MNDRALLEAAAKKPLIDPIGEARMDDTRLIELAGLAAGEHYTAEANPLDRDDLALRLAVKLRFSTHYETQFLPGGEMIDTVEIFYDRDPESGACKVEMLPLGADPGADTRRAIVRAAAALQETSHG
jgi:hypothetical protein